MSATLVGLRCRTSDATPGGGHGVEELAPMIGERLGTAPRFIGSPGRPHSAPYADDLRDSRGCLLEAGGQVADALDAGDVPILLAGDCSIALTTLPTVARLRPDARVLWLDAHGDFNTPATTGSAFLGGMCLAGACGLWETGFEGVMPAERVVLAGVRDLDPAERDLLERSPATVIGDAVETLVFVQNALDGAAVYVHLDLDVLDPEVFPALYPASGGLSVSKLYDLLEAVSDRSELMGLEVTAFEAPPDPGERRAAAATVLHALEPLLHSASDGPPG